MIRDFPSGIVAQWASYAWKASANAMPGELGVECGLGFDFGGARGRDRALDRGTRSWRGVPEKRAILCRCTCSSANGSSRQSRSRLRSSGAVAGMHCIVRDKTRESKRKRCRSRAQSQSILAARSRSTTRPRHHPNSRARQSRCGRSPQRRRGCRC